MPRRQHARLTARAEELGITRAEVLRRLMEANGISSVGPYIPEQLPLREHRQRVKMEQKKLAARVKGGAG